MDGRPLFVYCVSSQGVSAYCTSLFLWLFVCMKCQCLQPRAKTDSFSVFVIHSLSPVQVKVQEFEGNSRGHWPECLLLTTYTLTHPHPHGHTPRNVWRKLPCYLVFCGLNMVWCECSGTDRETVCARPKQLERIMCHENEGQLLKVHMNGLQSNIYRKSFTLLSAAVSVK